MCAVLFFTGSASAQVTTGNITGRVLDQNGAAVANATVTARHVGTGQTRTAQTNEEGVYTIAELSPGSYDITVEAANFSKAVVKERELNVGATQTLNFDMKPGQITEVVDVTSDLQQIETTKSDLGGVVTPIQVENLPLLNRTFAALSLIMPEARPAGNFDPTKTRVGNVAFNGGDGRQVDVNVDGGDNKDNVVGSLLQNFSYESIRSSRFCNTRTAEQACVGAYSTSAPIRRKRFTGVFRKSAREVALAAFREARALTEPLTSSGGKSAVIGGPSSATAVFLFSSRTDLRERQDVPVNAGAPCKFR